MTLQFRPAQPDDYPVVAAIHNDQNEPDFHYAPDVMRARDAASALASPYARRYVAELDDAVVATAAIARDFGIEAADDVRWLNIAVRADLRDQGIDTELLQHALRMDVGGVREVRSCIRADFMAAAGFLTEDRFEELYRSWGAHLDLTRFDPSAFEPVRTRLEGSGVRFVRYLDLAPDARLEERVVAFQRSLEEDAVYFEPVIPKLWGDLRSDGVLLESWTLAFAGENELIGIGSLEGPKSGDLVACGFTGVARAYRQRGVGTVLESCSATHAIELGCHDLNCGGGGTETPMLRLKRRLGYDVEPAWVTFSAAA